jgi:hypothetical protein
MGGRYQVIQLLEHPNIFKANTQPIIIHNPSNQT